MENEKLIVLWVTRDKEAALNMAFLYAKNSKLRGWWNEVDLIIWGPSVILAVGDEDIKAELKVMIEAGVRLRACQNCAERYGAADALRELGVDVTFMGAPLTEELKSGSKVISI